MNKTKWMTMAAVMTLSASLAVAAPHDGFKGKGGKRGGRHGAFSQRMAEKLNLTDAQKKQIEAINRGFRDNNKAVFESSRALREQFREAKQANDTAKLEALKPQLEQQRTQMQQLRQAHRAQIVAVLTPEQRTQWEALKAEREARRGERGPRGHRGNRR
jgi:periplasmic protein CpxP/Spy